ncbi:MAG TPA: 60S ribosomal export protein NMD3 [Thermoplasmata archaeon]|nr:60S ribosomal export protein NMD3 [Thermoplasmata archaeon]
MSEGEFCVVCGSTGRALTDGVCASCAAGRTTLLSVPEHAVVVICPHCGARKQGAKWERAGSSPLLGAEDLAPFLRVHPEAGIRRIHWEETSATATVRDLTGTAELVFRGTPKEETVRLAVRTEHQTCTDCSRKSGKYYTAVVQLRGGLERSSNEKSAALHARLDGTWAALMRESRPEWRNLISWREELPEGYDVFFTDTLAARGVTRVAKQKFHATIKESASLFGRKDGQDIYRVTFCLRFPRSTTERNDGAPPHARIEP